MQLSLNNFTFIGIIAAITGTVFAIVYFAFGKTHTPGEKAKVIGFTFGIVVLVIVLGIAVLNISSIGRAITPTDTPVSTITSSNTPIPNSSTSTPPVVSPLTPGK